MTKVLIFGASGMLGSSLARFFENRHSVEPIAVVRSVEASDKLRTLYGGALVVDDNILSETNLTAVIQKHQPEVVVNCIGIIKQKKRRKRPFRCHSGKLPAATHYCSSLHKFWCKINPLFNGLCFFGGFWRI